MLYACAFRAYYFIKGMQGGQGARRYCRPQMHTMKKFNTLQLRSFKKHKNGLDPAGALHNATQ